MKYDYLIVGAGLFGAVFAYEMTKKGKKCLIIEKRNHIGGNVFTQEIELPPRTHHGVMIFPFHPTKGLRFLPQIFQICLSLADQRRI